MKFRFFGVLTVVFTLFLGALTPFLSSSASGEELKGMIETLAVDKKGDDGKIASCETVHFFRTEDGERHQISLPTDTSQILSPGQMISVSGRWNEESVGEKRFTGEKVLKIADNAPTIRYANSLPTKKLHLTANSYLPKQTPVQGPQRTLIVRLWFDGDTPDNEFLDPNKIKDVVIENPHSVNNFYKICSGKKMWIDGDIFPEFVLMPPASNYDRGGDEDLHKTDLIRMAIAYSDGSIDFSKYDRIIFIRTGSWNTNFSTLGKWVIKTQDGTVEISIAFDEEDDIDLNCSVMAHEYGHSIGLVHANSVYLPTGEIIIYGDERDVMGSQYGLMSEMRKYALGWLPARKIRITESSCDSVVPIDQRELYSGGIKLLVIPIGFDSAGRPTFYFLEYFKRLGKFDSKIFIFYKDDRDAVLLRKYIVSQYGDSLIYMGGNDIYDGKILNIESQPFIDKENEFSVQVVQKTGAGRDSRAETRVVRQNSISPSISLDVIIEETDDGKGIVVSPKVKDSSFKVLQADKITCLLYDENEHLIFRKTKSGQSAIFYKKDAHGKVKVKVTASKNNYADVVTESFFQK